MREVVHHLHQSYGQSRGILVAAGEELWQQCLGHTAQCIALGAPFLVYDLALGVNLVAVESDKSRPVVQYEQAGVEQCLACRDIGDAVYGLVDGCIGIDIVTKLHPVVFKVADKRFAGEVLGAVECHVFEEVCESALVIFLEYGTNFLYDMELRPVLGLPVAQQIVCQSVVEFTVSHVFAQCYGIRGHLSPSSEAEYSHKGRKQVFFHIVRLSQLLIITPQI